ncbi:MAG: hypothetical protein AAGH48_05105, partial [Pseudomonadota bacterium]
MSTDPNRNNSAGVAAAALASGAAGAEQDAMAIEIAAEANGLEETIVPAQMTAPLSAPITVVGGDDADDIDGDDADDDFLDGGAGDDEILSSSGADTVIGGTGSDTIILEDSYIGSDTITGGEDGDGLDVDVIDLTYATEDAVTVT